MKKAEYIANKNVTLFCDGVVLEDVLDGWSEGIFAVGTFGLDSLNTNKERKVKEVEYAEYYVDYASSDYDVEGESQEEEEVNPLVGKYGSGSVSVADCSKPNIGLVVGSTEVKLDSDDSLNDGQKKKAQRTTLADLFSADTDGNEKRDSGEVTPENGKKPAFRPKNGLSFAKKLIPHVGDDRGRITKLQRLMTRMLKKKIHPDIEGKIQKSEGPNKAIVREHPAGNQYRATDTVSLLQTQGGIA